MAELRFPFDDTLLHRQLGITQTPLPQQETKGYHNFLLCRSIISPSKCVTPMETQHLKSWGKTVFAFDLKFCAEESINHKLDTLAEPGSLSKTHIQCTSKKER